MQTRDIRQVQNQTRAGFIACNEMDYHADTCCAGSNWSLMELTGEVCDVNLTRMIRLQKFRLRGVAQFGPTRKAAPNI
jgi:hypothetical protein